MNNVIHTKRNTYSILGKIGSGASGKVYKAFLSKNAIIRCTPPTRSYIPDFRKTNRSFIHL